MLMSKERIAKKLLGLAKEIVAADEIKVGDKVKYARGWLQSTGSYTELGHWKGDVKEVKSLGRDIQIATVQWDNGEEPMKVNTKNLVLLSKVHLERY
jgi:hypothetical protein